MQIVSTFFSFLALVALFGCYKPFIKNLNRWHFAGFALLFMVLGGTTAPEQEPPPPPTAEEIEAQKKQAAIDAKAAAENVLAAQRRRIGYEARSIVKNAARNPDSVVFESVRSNENASLVCLEFRAQNGFGGMNREFVVFYKGKPNQSPGVWNKRCRVGLFDLM